MGTRVYVGNLSSRTTEDDLRAEFDKIGKIMRIDMKAGFGFIEFDDPNDAHDAVKSLDGIDLDGNKIRVESARGSRGGGGGGPRGAPGGRRTDYRVTVEGIAPGISWQDLKDFARGPNGRLRPLYTEVFNQGRDKGGVIEYESYDDMKDALRNLHDTEFKGCYLKIYEERPRRGRSYSPRRGGGRSRSPRRGGGYGGGYRDERDRYDRRSPRYSRSRSPRSRDR